jgi:hypothetical protein
MNKRWQKVVPEAYTLDDENKTVFCNVSLGNLVDAFVKTKDKKFKKELLNVLNWLMEATVEKNKIEKVIMKE